jgi:hypothetical protein
VYRASIRTRPSTRRISPRSLCDEVSFAHAFGGSRVPPHVQVHDSHLQHDRSKRRSCGCPERVCALERAALPVTQTGPGTKTGLGGPSRAAGSTTRATVRPPPPTHMCTCRLMGARICSHVFALVMRRRHPAHRGLRHYHDRGHRLHRHHRRAAAFFAVPVSLQHAPCSGICVCSTGPRSRPICARSGQFMLLFRWRLLWVTVGRGGTVLERTCAFVRVCTLSSGFPVPDLSCGTCETVENAVVCSCRSIL